MLALNPWLILGASLVAVGALSGAYVKGRSDGKAVIIANQARDDQIRFETLQLAQQAAAEEIARIQVVNKTIYQRATREVLEKPVYRDCLHGPDGLRAINEALTAGAEPAGESSVPRPNTTRW